MYRNQEKVMDLYLKNEIDRTGERNRFDKGNGYGFNPSSEVNQNQKKVMDPDLKKEMDQNQER